MARKPRVQAGMLDEFRTLPLWAVVPAVFALVIAASEIGYRLGDIDRAHHLLKPDALLRELTQSVMSLLGLFLAFTFGWTATRFDVGRQARMDEAQAIAVLHQLSDVLPDPEQRRLKALLDQYIILSMNARGTDVSLRPREVVLWQLWSATRDGARRMEGTEVRTALLTAAVKVRESHLTRSALTTTNRIPTSIVVGLAAVLTLAMGLVGYRSGLQGSGRSRALVPLALSLALVIYLIADMNRGVEGVVRLANPLRELQRELHELR